MLRNAPFNVSKFVFLETLHERFDEKKTSQFWSLRNRNDGTRTTNNQKALCEVIKDGIIK